LNVHSNSNNTRPKPYPLFLNYLSVLTGLAKRIPKN